MKSISSHIIEEIITRILNIEIKLLKNHQYYQYESNKWSIITIFNSKLNLQDLKLDYYGLGKPILRYQNNKLKFYPPILNTISEEMKMIKLNSDKTKKISFGKDVKIDEDNGLAVIKDNYSRRIAFGRIVENKFIPIIDIGWYLREGK